MPDIDANNLPDDVEALRAMIVADQLKFKEVLNEERSQHNQSLNDALEQERTKHNESLKKERKKHSATLKIANAKQEALKQHIAVLEQQLAAMRRARFGKKSEQLDEHIHQLELMIEDLETTLSPPPVLPELESPENKPQSKARKALPEHLPREVIEHGKRESCEKCGNTLSPIGEDISEQLEYVPSSFRVIRHVRPKYSCACCNTIVQAPAASRPIARSYAGPGLLAHVAVAKFCDHLPLYRQSQIYSREGVALERSTLADWVGQICHLLRPLNNALQSYVLEAGKLHGDDTPVPVLQPGRKSTKLGRLWGYLRDDRPAGSSEAPAVWFDYTPDRRGRWPAQHLATYSGILQADGYPGYNALYATGRIVEAACWAHVRRMFFEIDQVQPNSFATDVLHAIAGLYAVEKLIKDKPPDQRVALRQAHAGPALEILKAQLRETLSGVSKKLPLAKAIHYALVRWDALVRYVDNGTIEIDNNPIERQIRPIAIGRKNYLFAGSDAGGERAAMMYSLINTAKLNGVEPEAYLTHVLSVIADHPVNRVNELLPWNVSLPSQ